MELPAITTISAVFDSPVSIVISCECVDVVVCWTMAYYLVEFKDSSLAVVPHGKVQAMSGADECVVEWRAVGKKKTTKHAAKILLIGGK